MGYFYLGAKMSKVLKYVIYDDIQPVLFSEMNQHSDFRGPKITSAGFCRITYDEDQHRFTVLTYGKSISLEVSNHDGDSRAIERILNEY